MSYNPSSAYVMTTRSKYDIIKPKLYAFIIHGTIFLPEAKHYRETLNVPKCKKAIEVKLCALLQNGTWELVKLPQGKTIIGYKWVSCVKLKADRTLDKYKACLVAKGFLQLTSVDFSEIFSHVVKPTTIRVILTIALYKC